MRHELYIRVLRAVSSDARGLLAEWLHGHGATGDELDDWWRLRDLARRLATSPSALLAELRAHLDAPFRPARPVLGPRDASRLLTAPVTLAVLRRVTGQPAATLAGAVLDAAFDGGTLRRELRLVNGGPGGVLAALDGMGNQMGALPGYAPFAARHWQAALTKALAPGVASSLRTALGCAPGGELTALLEAAASRRARATAAHDELGQPLDFLSIDGIRAALRVLVQTALAAAERTASGAARARPQGDLPGLEAAIAWYGSGDYQRALRTFALPATPFTLRARGFGLLEPDDAERLRDDCTGHRVVAVGLLRRGLRLWRTRVAVISWGGAPALHGPVAEAEGGPGALLEAALDHLAERLRYPNADPLPAEPDTAHARERGLSSEALLDAPLFAPPPAAALWPAALADPRAVAAFVLAGGTLPAAGLVLPAARDALSFPAPPSPLPTDTVVAPGPDLADWLKGGVWSEQASPAPP